ncbi:VacJ family lipoprotein [Succinivibrio sp.]|uniref:MlaA family lipoprotein n=1 Tax=Succinivibrio sp. TaxID=2053619 RepID=UPI002586B3D2|nr:VacJ family lipoprotein [Succinivibrio sp.]MDD6205397.1 VacJ family lipoprotein [Succinivibrio sp.]
MNIKIFALVAGAFVFTQSALASHSSYSPMSPRVLSVKASHSDYSYGLSVLPGNSIDSFEKFNRDLPWKTNYEILDRYMLRPVAHGYRKLPSVARSGIHNFFSNISDLVSAPNNLLLGEFSDSSKSFARFSINSTIGVLGLFDVAKLMGIEEKKMSFDTVMGRAGIDQGAYIMVPCLGPKTERSIHASGADNWPYYFIDPVTGLVLTVVDVVDSRAALIEYEEMVDKSVDPYATTRSTYLMYAQGKVDPNASVENKKDENVENYLDEIDE